MRREALNVEVAVIGSGCGGTLTALLLHQRGLRVAVLDQAAHPRFAIGESSTPVADLVLREVARQYDLPNLSPLSSYGGCRTVYPHLDVGRKRGFSYYAHRPGLPWQGTPDHANELLIAASNDDHACDSHWCRADFDAFLADQVRAAGIPLFEGVTVRPERASSGWRLLGAGGHAIDVQADFVVDASGRAAVLPRALGLNPTSTGMRTQAHAVFSHFDGVADWHDHVKAQGAVVEAHPYRCDEAALHHVLEGGWMWQLQFHSGRVSAGLMQDARRPSRPAEARWHETLARYPSLGASFADARIADPPGRLLATGILARRLPPARWPDAAVLPHTYGFVDPLHSTGLAHTFTGVERLVAVLTNHASPKDRAEGLRAYHHALGQELGLIDRLVSLCYEALHHAPHRPQRFFDLTMCYFAAVVTYEQRRLQFAQQHPLGTYNGAFLSADDPELWAMTDAVSAALSEAEGDGGSDAGFRARVAAAIKPFNTVGLLAPSVPNMYHHTAPALERPTWQ